MSKENIDNGIGCPKCGSTELHACPGHPIVWTDEDVARLHAALDKAFEENKKRTQ